MPHVRRVPRRARTRSSCGTESYGARPAPAAAAVLLYRGISLSVPLALGGVAWAVRPARPMVRSEESATRLSSEPYYAQS